MAEYVAVETRDAGREEVGEESADESRLWAAANTNTNRVIKFALFYVSGWEHQIWSQRLCKLICSLHEIERFVAPVDTRPPASLVRRLRFLRAKFFCPRASAHAQQGMSYWC